LPGLLLLGAEAGVMEITPNGELTFDVAGNLWGAYK
jgi:hypothetical protein